MPEKITLNTGKLNVPNNPIIPFIEEMVPGLIFGQPLKKSLMPQFKKLIMGLKK